VPFPSLILCFFSLPSGFRHDCQERVLALRAKNFSKMRKLVKKDRRDNNEKAEIDRLGIQTTVEEDLAENALLALASGAVVDETDSDSDDM